MEKLSLRILALLFLVNVLNFYDRQVLSAVTEPLRLEWNLTDTQIGWLGTAFTLLYAVVGVPLGRLADLRRRISLLAAGMAIWSALTFLSGFARGFGSLFAARLGVGVGEAACAPAAASLIGDLFKPLERARAMSIFMFGLPAGLSLSYVASGAIAQHWGWRYAFFVAGLPGLLLAALLPLIREPARGAAESVDVGSARRPGSPLLLILSIPTMWLIILSGALHNFNLYGISSFLPAYLSRYHQVSVQAAGYYSAFVIGIMGGAGMLLGGWLGDAAMRRKENGRMLVAAVSLLCSAPLSWLSLAQPPGGAYSLVLLLGAAYLLMYVYYATVYATIQDVIEPSLRGTAMAVYFFAMYVLGASAGPLGTGGLSDYLARRAAGPGSGIPVTEQFRAIGLHQAMHIIPIVAVVISAVLFVGAATVRKDMSRLRAWSRSASAVKP